ncbi:MAG TPA: SRPBCC family protein [Acidimicrobiales bacterium]|nr:SRPBCC family protein [Acidimicrobiales bacterium]
MTAFAFDRTWCFDIEPEELWSLLADTEQFPRWWPWLAGPIADGLCAGTVADVHIRAPLAYELHLVITVERVEPGRLVQTTVGGDLAGPARLQLARAEGGSSARLAWSLEPRRGLLVAGGRMARPVMAWAQDQVVAAGMRQFRRAALPLADGVRGGGEGGT